MAHQLVLVLIRDENLSVVPQVQELLLSHCGEPVGDELRFDFHTLGGRWDGIFAGRCDVGSNEADHLGGRVRDNICRVSELPTDFAPGSVVTPDGRLHFFGWRFGDEPIEAGPLRAWRAIRESHGACYAVAVDAHS